jgi:hypothetical protein
MNVNTNLYILNTIQASGADVVVSNGLLNVTGMPNAIPVNNVQSFELIPSLGGLGIAYTITSTAAIAANTQYEFTIRQLGTDNQIYSYQGSVTTGAVAPAAAVFYALVGQQVQNGIDGGQILGTQTNDLNGVVFTTTTVAPQALISGGNLSISAAAKTLTAAGSSATDASPRVLTAGAAHGLVDGKIYRIAISGVTGAGAADLNDVKFGLVTGATTLAILNTSATGAVVTTSATMTVINDGIRDLEEVIGGAATFAPAKSYAAVSVSFRQNTAVSPAPVNTQVIGLNLTDNTAADWNNCLNALTTALS